MALDSIETGMVSRVGEIIIRNEKGTRSFWILRKCLFMRIRLRVTIGWVKRRKCENFNRVNNQGDRFLSFKGWKPVFKVV